MAPTYRKLHARILESQDIADMPDDFCRLVWTWLPLILTSDGTTIYDARYLRSRLFPLRDDVTSEQVADVFAWLEERGMILPYEDKGRRYLLVPTFARYQGDTSREADSTFPKPPTDLANARVNCVQSSRNAHADCVQSSCNARADVAQTACSDTDAEADAHTDAGTDADTAAKTPPTSSQRRKATPIDHETTPEPELLRALHQAFQRGTGQAVTDALPTGSARAALRQLLDDDHTPADIEACARYLKAGWWHDKALTVPKLAEALGQWIAQGRPVKPNSQARASPDPAHQSPAIAAFREFQKMQEGDDVDNHRTGSGDAGFGVSAGQDRGSHAGRVSGSPG